MTKNLFLVKPLSYDTKDTDWNKSGGHCVFRFKTMSGHIFYSKVYNYTCDWEYTCSLDMAIIELDADNFVIDIYPKA